MMPRATFMLFAVLLPLTSRAAATCQPVSDEKAKQLVEFVQQKYRLAFEVTIVPSNITPVGDTCYRKIKFTSTSGAEQRFAISLYLSPDLRFLSRELMDSTTDPMKIDREANKKLLAKLDTDGSPEIGPRDAAVTITLFSDFECPFCRQQARILREEVLPSEPDVRLVFKNLPLSFHPWSEPAAELASCAAVQNGEAFWQLHDFLFAHQSEITPSSLRPMVTSYLSSIEGVKMDKFETCIDSSGPNAAVSRDLALAKDLGIEATPSLFVNTFRVNGVASAEQLQSLIRQVKRQSAPLSATETPAPQPGAKALQ